RIPEDFVTLNGDQNVWSVLTFNEPLTVDRKLVASGSLSGQNLHKLATESLLRDKPQVLSHPIKFETIVFRGDVLVAHHVDNVDLSALALRTFVLNGEEFVVHMSPYSYNFSAYISKSDQMVAPIGPSISYIEVFSLSPTIVFLISYQTTTGKLLVHSLETDSHNKYKFSQVTESNVGTGTSKVVAFMRQNQVYVVVAKQYGLNCMTDNTGTLILILKNYRTLELIQTIPVLNVGDVVHFENYGKDYLAISDGISAVMSSKGRQSIYIYRTDSIRNNCGFSLFQTI
ncbi:unnamed protein product, partial [Medioppia subpectinata]